MATPFQTPQNERSFSGLIDAAIVQTGKPQQLIAAVSAANLTVRECQAFGLFAQNLIEAQWAVDVTPYIWTRPAYFRKIRTIKYVNACVYPDFLLPGKVQKDKDYYFYAANNYFAFKGADIGETINSAIYYWNKPLIYYSRLGQITTQYPGGPYATRPAYFDILLDIWQYLSVDGLSYSATTGDAVEDALRQVNATNWLIDQWYELILSGTKAKLWAQSSDTRGTVEFSAYKQSQKLMTTAVGYEAEGF